MNLHGIYMNFLGVTVPFGIQDLILCSKNEFMFLDSEDMTV